MHPLLAHQLQQGLPDLRGARLHGAVPLRQDVVSSLLAGAPAPLRDVQLEIQAGNRLVVRYGVVQATATLDEAVATGASPRIGIRLASTVLAFALRQVLRLPYVHVDGRQVTIDLGAVPALAEYRAVWPHVRDVRLVTSPGVLVIGFAVQVA
jgi:hypothetical protein